MLQDAGIKLSSVASDILGKSGRDMLDALVAGTHDPEVLAELARGRLRVKIPLLERALRGRFGPTHAVVVGEILAHLDYLDEAIVRLFGRIDEVIAPFGAARELLCSIPGIDRRLAEGIIGEIGVDMSRFPTAQHLASWAGMCPGQHESAGKSRRGGPATATPGCSAISPSQPWPRHGTKDSYFAAQYAQLVRRRGKAKARKAVGHSLLVAIWHMLTTGELYNELGHDWFEKRNSPERRARRHLAELARSDGSSPLPRRASSWRHHAPA